MDGFVGGVGESDYSGGEPTLQCSHSSKGVMVMQAQSATTEHLSPELANLFLAGLPEKIRLALEARAVAMNYPVWAIVEMAIAGYLDDEALSFVDCQPRLD
ncbi:MAG: hypothetical protein RLZZ511_3838 [Cyanobacteriota bacterium]